MTKPLVLSSQELPEDLTEFPVLPLNGTITQGNETRRYQLDEDALKDLVLSSGYGPEREIPIDFEHKLYYTANEHNQEEAEYDQAHPGEKLSAGWVKLKNTKDGVIAELKNLSNRADKLIKEKAVKYISPVVRNFGGKMRISSLALTNTPAINELPPLIASALEKPQTQMEVQMDLSKIIQALNIQKDLVASDNVEKQVDVIVEAINSLKSENEQLVSEKKEKELSTIIASAKAEGKLTNEMEDWAKNQTVEALKSWSEVAPVVVPKDEIVASQIVPVVSDNEPSESDDVKQIKESFSKLHNQNNEDE